MIESLSSGILGSLLGGLFRLAPELIKLFDRKNERAHELSMFGKQCELEQTRGQIKLDEIGAQRDLSIDTGIVSAFKSVIDQQAEMVKEAGKGWVAALSAAVRPITTYYLLGLYGIAKAAVMVVAMQTDQGFAQILAASWTQDDMALLCGAINYWFMDRTLAKRWLL